MFVIMFLAVVLELIASMGTFGALVAQNLYTNSAAGWYIRLDWTAVYTYAVSIFSILISFSLTVGALARNASDSKRTCSGWFNPFAIFLTSFILSVLWVVIAGFAYRNPLPMRYPCDIFRHLRGSLEMLGLTSGKSLVEEGGLLVGICQSSKAFLVLAGIGLGLWILILILSCVAMGTGLNPPSKKSNPSSSKSSSRSIRTLISSITSRKSEKRRLDELGAYKQQQTTCHACYPPNSGPVQPPVVTLPLPAAADANAATGINYNNLKSAYNGHTDEKYHYRPSSCYNPACLQMACTTHQTRPGYTAIKTACAEQHQCTPSCPQHTRTQARIYTHHRNRHSAVNNIARTPSFASEHKDSDNQQHANLTRQRLKDKDGHEIMSGEPLTGLSINNVSAAAAEESLGKHIGNSEYNNTPARHPEAGHREFQRTDQENSHQYAEEYTGNYSSHHQHYHHHNPHIEQHESNSASPQSSQSRRQRLKQLFNRDAEHQV